MKLRALLFALALAACGQTGAEKGSAAPATPEAPDPFDLSIQIGRAGAMLSTVESLTEERPGSAEADTTAPTELARNLRETVWQYNVQRSELCAKGLFPEVACGPAYEPVWISEPADAAPTLAEIQTRTSAVHDEVQRLWGAVCDDARSRVPEDEQMAVCPME